MSADIADRADRAVPTGPAAGPPRPSRSAALRLRWRAVRRSAALPLALAAVVGLVVGMLVGRATSTTIDDAAVDVVVRDVLPLVVDADGVWTAGSGDLPAVGDRLHELRRTGDVAAVAGHVDAWDAAYDNILRRIVGVEVPVDARPVQRQFVAAITASRDAVAVLAAAVAMDDAATRRELTSEALRLRLRSEQQTQSAYAALRDLQGAPTTGVSVPPPVPSLADLR